MSSDQLYKAIPKKKNNLDLQCYLENYITLINKTKKKKNISIKSKKADVSDSGYEFGVEFCLSRRQASQFFNILTGEAFSGFFTMQCFEV